ncbi:MAG: heme biosynthesis HemY N-terminal domain-containing protein [Gammaproteobacteria bacterium]
MRKSLVLLFLAILASVLTHFVMQEDRGYVLISFLGLTVETSVPVLIMSIALIYLLIRLVIYIFRAPRKFGQAVSAQRQQRARRKLNRGLIEMAEGNWKKGESMLAQGAKSGEMPLLNYINAAKAAQLQGEHERRDNWLMLAYEQDPEASTAVLLTQAELQIGHEQYEEALATLRKVEDSNPKHTHAKVLMGTIYEKLGDWDSLYALLPELKKIKKSPAMNDITRLIAAASRHQLIAAGTKGDKSTVNKTWNGLTLAARKETELVSCYARALCDCKDHNAAEQVVKKAMGNQWSAQLASLYGNIETDAPKKQLAVAESWLQSRGDDSSLLIACARLAMRSELWGKARSYLESSLSIDPQPHAYQIYGELLTQLGETDNAAAAFRQGLAQMTGGVNLTPVLTGPDSTQEQEDAQDDADKKET